MRCNLAAVNAPKVSFDPQNEAHLASLKSFLESGKWGAARFTAEWPHVDVPTTCLYKLALHALRGVRASNKNNEDGPQ